MLNRRSLLLGGATLLATPALARPWPDPFAAIYRRAEDLGQLRSLIVSRSGRVLAERGFHGGDPARPANIKSASKSIISAMIGIAISKGLLDGVDQKIAPLLADRLPDDPDPRMGEITVGNLLSMQPGLAPTSGNNYGRWVMSRDWVRTALAMPFVADPGTGWQYSTGATHLLSAILTRVGGRPTRDLLEDWFDPVTGFVLGGWQRDPQGIYFGGNQMAMSARSLLAFGEIYRNTGRTTDGTQVVPADWVEASFVTHARSFQNGDAYGYCWFSRLIAGQPVHYAWGFGGQMLYLVPGRDLTIVVTSGEEQGAARTGYLGQLHSLVGDVIRLLGPVVAPTSA